MTSPNVGVKIAFNTDCSRCCPRKVSLNCCCCHVEDSDKEDDEKRQVKESEKKIVRTARDALQVEEKPKPVNPKKSGSCTVQ